MEPKRHICRFRNVARCRGDILDTTCSRQIQFELKSRKLERQAVSVITQVVVDKEDKAFQTPVKPIGMFYTKQEADRNGKGARICICGGMQDVVIVV